VSAGKPAEGRETDPGDEAHGRRASGR
jgi:hypothetical protein